jgi:hypothetical protein
MSTLRRIGGLVIASLLAMLGIEAAHEVFAGMKGEAGDSTHNVALAALGEAQDANRRLDELEERFRLPEAPGSLVERTLEKIDDLPPAA